MNKEVKTIVLQVRADDNEHLLSLRVEFKSRFDLEETLKRVTPFLLVKGKMQIESNLLNLSLNGVAIQKNANEDRQKYYHETGN